MASGDAFVPIQIIYRITDSENHRLYHVLYIVGISFHLMEHFPIDPS